MVQPEQVDEEFFSKTIENVCGAENGVEIDSVEITNGSAGGENYCSDILRCAVKYRLSDSKDKVLEKALIVKCMRVEKNSNVELKTMETHLYGVVIPEMEKVFQRNGISVSMSPKWVFVVNFCVSVKEF